MKKLAAMTALAVVLAAPAFANDYHKNSMQHGSNMHNDTTYVAPGSDYTLKDRDLRNGEIVKTERTTWRGAPRKPMPGEEPDFTGTYALQDGRTLEIDGTTAFVREANSRFRFYAPNGSYVTARAETFFTDSGQVLRMENAPETVAVDTNGSATMHR